MMAPQCKKAENLKLKHIKSMTNPYNVCNHHLAQMQTYRIIRDINDSWITKAAVVALIWYL